MGLDQKVRQKSQRVGWSSDEARFCRIREYDGATQKGPMGLRAPIVPKSCLFPDGRVVLTTREVAGALNVSVRTVERLLKRRKLRALRSLRHKRIPVQEVERFLAE